MSSYITPSDCLVLKLEEIDSDLDKLDTTIYILYDQNEEKYVVRGRRGSSTHTYSFDCKCACELTDFLAYLVCKNNKVNEILYNYKNLPLTSDEITFQFLQENESSKYEISGYDNLKLKKKNLFKNLKMLQNVFNYCN